MRIRELYIKNFGKFSEKRFLLEDGIHIFYGENEYGKSTIYAFIKAMLFGMERGRGKAALNDEFSRYEPWENPNYYAGIMRFTCGGRSFRLERQFDRYGKSASLVCEDDGEELSVEQGDLEMLLDGMTLAAFENTAAIGQFTARPAQSLSKELQNYAANYYETGSSGVDLNDALEVLKEKRREIEKALKRQESVKQEKCRELRQQCSYIEQDLLKLEAEQKENLIRQREAEKREEASTRQRENERYREASTRQRQKEKRVEAAYYRKKELLRKSGMAACIAGVTAGVGAIACLLHAPIRMVGAVLLITGVLLILSGIRMLSRAKSVRTGGITEAAEEMEDSRSESDRDLERERQQIDEEGREKRREHLKKLQWTYRRIEEEIREKQVQRDNLQEQLEELEFQSVISASDRQSLQALELAESRMKEAAERVGQGFGELLNRRASEILAEVTDGRYSRLLIEENLEMTLLEDGRRIPADRVSRGTAEQIYFSLRMAAVEILYEDSAPVILDDAFAFYDEKRLKSTLKWLSEQPRQVIIFTCRKREAEILNEI